MRRLSRRLFLQASTAVLGAACAGEVSELDPQLPGNSSDTNAEHIPPQINAEPPFEEPAPMVPADLTLAELPENASAFPLGQMAGDATADAVILWTRYKGTQRLGLKVVELAHGEAIRVAFDGEIQVGPDGFTHVEVKGLQPGAFHQYAFLLGDADGFIARGPIGQFRAALASEALEIVTFGGTSCTHQKDRKMSALSAAASRNLDFFLHAGDHVYTDSATDLAGNTVGQAVTLAEYRSKYRDGWTAAGMKAVHRSAGLYLTWDDHEIDNNWDAEVFSASRLENAKRAFFEHRALRRDGANPDRLWRSFRWGRTVEVFILDCRSERKTSTRTTASAQLISPEQSAWLKDGLDTSQAVFKVILTSVPMTDFEGEGTDRWEGFAAQRKDLLSYIDNKRIKGVFWLSGDHHFGSAGRVDTTGPGATQVEILMGPGGTAANATKTLPKPQFDTVVNVKNITLFKADPYAKTLEVSFVNEAGKVIFTREYPVPA